MKRTFIFAGVIWVLLIGISFQLNLRDSIQSQEKMAKETAKSFFYQVVVSRAWNAQHGGVYVPVTEATQPNEYLDDPRREIVVDENLTLTKINPAYMTRQISELAQLHEGIKFHITSLNPIRPENVPTTIEKEALEKFETGVKEIGFVQEKDDFKSYFYMAPLSTADNCLKCHAKQGYQLGDVRGGISVEFPYNHNIPFWSMFIGHLSIGLFGLLGLGISGTKLNSAYEAIRRQSVIDALTGIHNRRSFSERILTEYNRSQRDQSPLSIIMGDIDNFKKYNDTYGHKLGDDCLIKVAKSLQNSLSRASDFCARYGGEEFIIILPNTPLDGAKMIAEKIRDNIEKLDIPHEKSPPQKIVTISLGVATKKTDDELTYEQLISNADVALYDAKNAGRNRIKSFNSKS